MVSRVLSLLPIDIEPVHEDIKRYNKVTRPYKDMRTGRIESYVG